MFDQMKALAQLGPMMAKAREMQAKMQEVQAKLPNLRATGSSGGSLVTATCSGLMEILAIEYATSAPLTDTELLADLTRAAVNQAIKNAQALVQKEMGNVGEGIDMNAVNRMLGQMP